MYIAIAVICFIALVLFIANSNSKDNTKEKNKEQTRQSTFASNSINNSQNRGNLFMVFDTETGGLSADDNDILQLSYQIVDRNTYQIVKEVNEFFPWPADKSRVKMGAIRVNGLTESYLATKVLSNRKDAIARFFQNMSSCSFVVAHNGEFDKKFINATARREHVRYVSSQWPLMIDTMKTTIDLCRLPPHPGRSGYNGRSS